MAKDANQFIVDFTDEFTREELVEMIDHALAALCLLPDGLENSIHKRVIAEPLTCLHYFFYNHKNN